MLPGSTPVSGVGFRRLAETILEKFVKAGRFHPRPRRACSPIRDIGDIRGYFNVEFRTVANLVRPSRICARDQAAKPKVSAGCKGSFM